MTKVTFIGYTPSLANAFMQMNLSWIEKYFEVEPMDRLLLSDPQTHIIEEGGHIYFAIVDEHTIGTFALLKKDNDVYELGKMAVSEKVQGQKIGSRMLEFCIAEAKRLNIRKLILFSNTILEPAIHLYRKYGFKEVPAGDAEYKRSNIKMELDLN
jgi:N-acetylglutamate synthase-like GNAT family acetyltransferase